MSKPPTPDYVPALGFNWLTPCYDAVVGVTTRERTFKKALIAQANVQPDDRVLDLASGTGTLAIWLKEHEPAAMVDGVDGDKAILQTAGRKAQKAGASITFDHGLSYDLPYSSAHFDRVVSSLFFHHLTWENKQRTAQEIIRVLKPGGELHVADWGYPANLVMRGLFFSIQLLDGFGNTRDNVNGRLVELFEQAGFLGVEARQNFNTIFGTMTLYSARKAG